MRQIDPPADEAALERLLRDEARGPAYLPEASPWYFVYDQWPEAYLRQRVWPLVSRLLVDDDEVVRERAVEFVRVWHAGHELTAERIAEVAERHAALYGDQRPEGLALRHQLYFALSNRCRGPQARRIATVLRELWLERADDDTPALAVARYLPEATIERARRTSEADLAWLRGATTSIALHRRDFVLPLLRALRHLPEAARKQLVGVVEDHLQRDDDLAQKIATAEGLPPPSAPAPSADECRLAIGLDAPASVEEQLAAARATGQGERRAARLYVVAARVAASGDLAQARTLFREAADAGSAYAALELGLMLASGRGGAVDAEASVGLIARAAALGLPTAAALLGGSLLTRPDQASEGIRWLRQAAAAEDGSAFWLLGTAYLRGLGVAPDAAQARVMLQAAAQQGIAEAQLELAAMYATGVGGARDEAAAAAWERRAAEAGHPLGCWRVAERALAQPGGVARALPWLERAAEGGSADAAERLARLYSDGRELPRDEKAAARWRARAEELGR